MKNNKQIKNPKKKNIIKTQAIAIVLLAIATSISLTPRAYADASLGSTLSTNNLELSPGQQQIVEATFFNTGNTVINLYIEQITPVEKTSGISDIKAYIMQKENNKLVSDSTITLEQIAATKTPLNGQGATWVVLGQKGDLYIPAKKVYFLIKVPEKQTYAKNKYELIFRARSQNANIIVGSASASIGQVREFPVTVTINNIIPNPDYADRETGPPEKSYTPLTRTTFSQQDANDNYINNYIPKSDTIANDSPHGNDDAYDTQGDGHGINNTGTETEGIKDRITGLVTGVNPLSGKAYNSLTVIIVLIGIFVLYRVLKANN